MDQTQLQEKIALYYKKLPEETKVLFAGMSWIETLQEINSKYSLNEEQIKTLGTETTILLLGIISLEDYVQTIKTEIKIEPSKIDELLDEVGNKILKDIAPLMYDSYNKNVVELMNEKFGQKFDERFSTLPNKIQEAIEDSKYQTSIYNIGNKYLLNISQIGELEEITTKVMIGLVSPGDYESEIKSKIKTTDTQTKNIVSEINELVFKNIKEVLKENWNKNETKIPVPPYINLENKKIEQNNSKQEIPLPPYKENTLVKDPESPKLSEKEISDDLYKESGIEIIQDEAIPEFNKQENVIKKPINILSDKLVNKTVSPKIVTDYSIPKINPQSTNTQINQVPQSKPHDPYHEAI